MLGARYVQMHVSSTQKARAEIALRGHPYMTSALRGGGGVSPKEDVVREVA